MQQHGIDQIFRRMLARVNRQAAPHMLADGDAFRQWRVLWQVGNLGAGLHEPLAPVEIHLPREAFQQRRLAGTVPADETDPFALGDSHVYIVEQNAFTEGEPGVAKGDDRRGGRGSGHAQFIPRCLAIRS